jgi:hypothetical protein
VIDRIAVGTAEVQHLQAGQRGIGLETAAHLVAVHHGQRHVEDDDVRPAGGRLLQGLGPIGGFEHLEAGAAQQGDPGVPAGVVVVDDEHADRRIAHALLPTRSIVRFSSAAASRAPVTPSAGW